MQIEQRARVQYKYFKGITTRWMDNDAYGHVNNVVYYSWFDTVVNQYMIDAGVLHVTDSSSIGLVVETQCNYFSPISFPEQIEVGLRVARVGKSSIRYELGIFRTGANVPSAQGHFVHVFVDRRSRRPCDIPAATRAAVCELE